MDCCLADLNLGRAEVIKSMVGTWQLLTLCAKVRPDKVYTPRIKFNFKVAHWYFIYLGPYNIYYIISSFLV